MTPNMKKMLVDIVDGAVDPNLIAQVAGLVSPAEERRVARTLLALYRCGMLEIASSRGLQITEKGRAAVQKSRRRK